MPSDTSDDDFEPPKQKRKKPDVLQRATEMLEKLKAPPSPCLSSSEASELIEISSASSDDEQSSHPEEHQSRESLKEWRRIREEQDVAYQQSLQIDRVKAQKAIEQQRAEEQLEDLRESFRNKLNEHPSANQQTGISVAIRLPSGKKMQNIFSRIATAEDLYHFAFAAGGMSCPFRLYTSLPRHEIQLSTDMLVDIDVAGTLLTLEELEGGTAGALQLFGAHTPNDMHTSLGHTSVSPSVAAPREGFSGLIGDVPGPSGGPSESISGPSEGVPNPVPGPSESISDPSEDSRELWTDTLMKEHQLRTSFMDSYTPNVFLPVVKVRRSCVFKDTIDLYANNTSIVHQMPLKVHFHGEQGVDTGGLGRDLFSAFWEVAYRELFEGCSLLVPAVHAHINMQSLPVLGKIISHGYLSCGYLPVRVAFPTLATVLLGPVTDVPPRLLLQAFRDYLTPLDRSTIREATKAQGVLFGDVISTKLISILSRFGCRQVPSPNTLSNLLVQVARHEFISRPFAAITLMSTGIPPEHRPFWQNKSLKELHALYIALNASVQKVLELIDEPVFTHPSEERVFGYLREYVANLKADEVQNFLRFVTGSGVCMNSRVSVSFNALSGLGRRPIAHTCACQLELPTTYTTYLDFASEFTTVLADECCWEMQSI